MHWRWNGNEPPAKTQVLRRSKPCDAPPYRDPATRRSESINVARQALDRWKRVSPNPSTDREWTDLRSGDMDALVAAIVADTVKGQRIRQSSPLVSVLSISERDGIRAYAEAEYLAKIAIEEAAISSKV